MTDWSFFEDHEPEDGITGVREAVVAAAWMVADDLVRKQTAGEILCWSMGFRDPDTPGPEIQIRLRQVPKLDSIRVSFAIDTATGKVTEHEPPEER